MDLIRRRAGLTLMALSLFGFGMTGCGNDPDATGDAGIGPAGVPAPDGIQTSEEAEERRLREEAEQAADPNYPG